MGRRGENIRKRSDGRWEARVICGSPVDGRTSYKYLYSRTYKGVRELKKKYLSGLDSPPDSASEVPVSIPVPASKRLETAEPPKYTDAVCRTIDMRENPILFRTVAAEWLATKKLSVKESSYAAYSFMVEKHLLPEFGDSAVKDMDTDRIGAFLLAKKKHGGLKDGTPLSDKTLSEIKGTLNRILRYAKSHNLIDAVPDSLSISTRQAPVVVLTKQEQKSLEEQALMEDTPYSLGVLLCLYTGIREGEVCGLQWADFNWADETVSISRTVSRISDVDTDADSKTHVVVGTPKTICSIRTVPLPTDIVPYIKERAGEDSIYVVTGNEKCMEPRVCRSRFKYFQKKAGVKYHKFHNLRHTYATNCIEMGIDIKTLSENLGHSDVNITLQRYVHPSMESKKAQVNKLSTFAASKKTVAVRHAVGNNTS
ncbi:MAG: tyrosine-type recombinase/integrase [Lachnospiraceae bacterium]|nr:tyrosine-type recombinase/integrase [Lachnospiraceae bacterium]